MRIFALVAATTTTLLALQGIANAAVAVTAVGDTQKIRPTDPPPPAQSSIALSCAQNEFCTFQVAVSATGAAGSVSDISVGDLTGPGKKLDGSSALIYREGLLDISTVSNSAGVTGQWPDPLIPKVDEFYGETRNAFPAPVAAGQTQGFWIEIHIPDGQTSGTYTGKVTVSAGGSPVDLMLSIQVRGFSLPSTSSLGSAYGFDWDGPCVGHFGGYGPPNCDDAHLEAINALYFQDALNHRLTVSELVYAPPISNGMGDFTSFDTLYGPFLDGTALKGSNQLKGAKITEITYTGDQKAASYASWATHFKSKGWFDRVFDYTCDEPPNGCAWSDIVSRAAIVHAGDPNFRTLTTTSIQEAMKNNVLSSLDILVPILNYMDGSMDDPYPGNQRSQYDAFLMQPNKLLWMYQSCEPSSSCSNGDVGGETGHPTMFIDESAISNRVMQWMDFEFSVSTDLYYDTTYAMSQTGQDSWATQYEFGNNGDGSIWYPGKPSVIGGTKDIPIESLRMKMLRAGMQDYEYMALLAKLGDAAFAQAQVATVVNGTTISGDPKALAAARLAMAARIEKDMGTSTGAGPGSGGSGSTAHGSSNTTGAGGGNGTGGSNGVGGNAETGGSSGCSCQEAPIGTSLWWLGALPLALARLRRRSKATRLPV